VDADRDITALLSRWADGEDEVREELIPAVYNELRRLAGGFIKRERDGHTLQPTALVHEALVRWFDQRQRRFANRGQFYGLIAQLMRRVLVDHARRRQSDKRGGGVTRVELEEAADQASPSSGWVILDVERALTRLETLDERQARIAEMRIYGGFNMEEIASALAISKSTVKREWRIVRAWFHREFGRADS